MLVAVALINAVIGALVGVSGIAGFLLPVFYTSVMKMGAIESLALSFAAFVVSGTIGSLNYYRNKALNIKFASILSIGSFVAGFLGVRANILIPDDIMKTILYMVVLLSGISILFRKDVDKDRELKYNNFILIGIGFATGFICSISGAGGPILVLPILIMMGIKVREAVGIALFNSIFIGIPAATGYMIYSGWSVIGKLLPIVLISHGVGVYLGSKNAGKINQKVLKKTIAIFSVLIAIYRLFL